MTSLSRALFGRLTRNLRGSGGLSIMILLDRDQVTPGEEVVASVEISGHVDEQAQAIHVALEGTGSYNVAQRKYSEHGESEVPRTVTLHHERKELPLATGDTELRFTVPPDAAPTSSGTVKWEVIACVERKRAPDLVEHETLWVIPAPEQIPTSRDGADPERDGLTLVGVPAAVAEDGELSGTLVVELAEKVTCSAVRVRLHRRCTYVGEVSRDLPGSLTIGGSTIGSPTSHIVETDQEVEVDLDGKREFAAGRREQYDFTVGLPDGARPSTQHPHATVEWVLEGVVDRRMRGDLTVEAPIFVYATSWFDDEEDEE